MMDSGVSRKELTRLQALIEPVGIPSSLHLTVAKLYSEPPEENKHIIGHHVGSWSFVPKRRTQFSEWA